jgi:DMATS type aromatic prenyltransferase
MNEPLPVDGASVAHRTFAEFGAERLDALCNGLGAPSASRELVELFRLLVRPWGAHRIGTVPRYVSNVADDQAPFELAIALSNGPPEIQVYVDPQGEPPTPRANLAAARDLLGVVADRFGVSLERFRAIESLFLPENPGPPFALWIGGSWTPGRDILLKIYLNPQVRGRAAAPEVIREAMQHLGLGAAWRCVERTLSVRDGRDELGIVALDLAPSGPTRLKLYIRHHRASVPLILPVAQLTGEFEPNDVETFYGSLSETQGPFLDKPIATVFAFREAGSAAPEAVTLAFPIGKYVANDEIARERIQRCLRAFGLPTDAYERAIHALAIRPLTARAGIHAHVTLRRLASGPRLGVYFASEAYGDMRWPEQPPHSG